MVILDQGAAGHQTIDRRDRFNSFDVETARDFREAGLRMARDAAVRAVVLRGEGGVFSSGADLKYIRAGGLTPDLDYLRAGGAPAAVTPGAIFKQILEYLHSAISEIRRAPKPFIAAVDGICVGAGAIVAMASDLRLGTPEAKTAFLFTRVGLAGCDMGACAMLPRIIGQGRAAELLYTGRAMTAEEGAAWGFFNRLASPETVLSEATKLARELASGPTFANGMTKRILDMEWAMSIESAIDAEAVAQALCMKTEDFTRAFRAFAAKQKPVFEGN